jgi:hypothetical protein
MGSAEDPHRLFYLGPTLPVDRSPERAENAPSSIGPVVTSGAMSTREIVGWLFLLSGAGFFLGAAALYVRARAAARWASAPGRITSSRVDWDLSLDGGARTRSYRVHLVYEYEVDGRKLAGKRLEFGDSLFGWMGSRKSARSLQESFPEGRAVTVYYDPAHPERCTLSREVDEQRFRMLLVAAAIIAAAGAGVLGGYVKVQ